MTTRWGWRTTHTRTALICFIAAFAIRLIAVPITIHTGINPYTHSDAIGFATTASRIATLIAEGTIVTDAGAVTETHTSATYWRWGLFLAPFWLIPGPSLVYATVFLAIVGSGSVYNVSRIASEIGGGSAGLFAAFPMAVYPSFVFVNTAIVRDTVTIFCLTAITLLVITRTTHPAIRIGVAGLLSTIAVVLRPENAALIVLAVVAGGGLWLVYRLTKSEYAVGMVAISALVGGIVSIPYLEFIRSRLLWIREVRSRGRTSYDGGVSLESSADALIEGGEMAVYFLFSPFPSMIGTVADAVIFIEVLITAVFCFGALLGVGVALRKHPAAMGALLVTFVAGVVVFGLATANVGTAVRHRQAFLWVVFVVGALGLDCHFGATVERALRAIRRRVLPPPRPKINSLND